MKTRTRDILLALLAGLVCVAMATPAMAQKKNAGATDPSPSGVELGAGVGRVVSFARALHGLAANMPGSTSGFSGGPFQTTYTSKTDQMVCGFKVTGSLEQLDGSPHHTQPVTDPNDPTKIIQPSFKTGQVQEEALSIQIEVPPESLSASEEKRSFLLTFTTEESGRDEEKPNTSLHLVVRSQNFGMDALIDHAKTNGCSIEEEWKDGRVHTLIRLPKTGK